MLGIDGGIANMGLGAFRADLVFTQVRLHLFAGDVITTSRSAKKRGVSVISDDHARWRAVAIALADRIDRWGVDMIVAEERSFPRGATAVKSVSAAWPIIITVSCLRAIPVVAVSPKQLKSSLCGSVSASKSDVAAEVLRRHPAAAATIELAGVPDGRHEHFFDACGAAEACKATDEVLAWLR